MTVPDRLSMLAVLALAVGPGVFGQRAQPEKSADLMIPMRDGVKLHTEIWRDKGQKEKLPCSAGPQRITVTAHHCTSTILCFCSSWFSSKTNTRL